MTGKIDSERAEDGHVSPFPVNQVIYYTCLYLQSLEGILSVMSLYLYKLDIIDRKWMNVVLYAIRMINSVCKLLSKDNKFKRMEL